MTVQDVLPLLRKVKKSRTGWMACCPAHPDENPSLSVSEGADGKLLMNCLTKKCSFKQILDALQPNTTTNGHKQSKPVPQMKDKKQDIVAIYDYTDEAGKLLYQAVRYQPKAFKQRRPDEKDGWVWNLEGVRRVLYRLPELLKSDTSLPVFIVEGEKDADNLIAQNAVATTNAGGAVKWRDEYNEPLRGRDVVILPDNDEPGRKHAEQVAHALKDIAKSIRIINLQGIPDKGDVTDWLEAGHTITDLDKLISKTPIWVPELGPETQVNKKDESPLRVKKMSTVKSEEVSWLWPPYLPLGKLTMLDGEEGIGKSWLLCAIAGRVSQGEPLPFASEAVKGKVLLLSGSEDGLGDTIRPRLDAAGADCDQIYAVDEPFSFDSSGLIKLSGIIAELEPSLVVIDPLFDYVTIKTDINNLMCDSL